MRSTFVSETPVAKVDGGLVHIEIGGAPMVTCTVATARRFCERTIRKLDAFEAEQAGRVVPMRKRRHG